MAKAKRDPAKGKTVAKAKAKANPNPNVPAQPLPLREPPKGPGTDAFWAMIARIERASGGELAAACTAFRAELEALDDVSLRQMTNQFRDAMVRAMDYELWSGAYVLHGGCSDDSFWDFRAGLVALGRDHYEAALADPDTLAAIPDVVERTIYEGFQYVPGDVLEARGLEQEPPAHGPGGARPTRARIPDAEFEERFPLLSKL